MAAFGKLGESFVEISARTAGLERDLKHARRQTEVASGKMARSFGRFDSAIARSGKRVAAFRSSLVGATAGAGALIAALGVRKIIQYADSWKNVESRLKLVTSSTEELRDVQEKLFRLAQDTGQSFGSVADLYTRVARSADELGLSQEQLLQLTEAVSKAVLVSGASGSSAAAGLLQLSQGLGAGVLRGEEFNSVMENTPRIAEALADGLDVGVASLRQMAEAGELTADVVIPALISQLEKLRAEAELVGNTVERAWQRVTNATERLVGQTDSAAGATDELADALNGLARVLEDPRFKEFTTGFLAETVRLMQKVVEDLAVLGKILSRDFSLADIGIVRVLDSIIKTSGEAREEAVLALADIEAQVAKVGQEATKAAGEIAKLGGGGGGDPLRVGPIVPIAPIRPSPARPEPPEMFGPPEATAVDEEIARGKAMTAEIERQTAARQKQKEVQDAQEAAQLRMNAAVETFSAVLARTTTEFLTGEQSFEDFARAIIGQLIQLALSAAIAAAIGAAVRTVFGDYTAAGTTVGAATATLGALSAVLGGAGAAFGAGLGSAKGNAFDRGRQLKRFRRGGVVTRPQFFPMADGGIGMMGEAGPEAIMPLGRTPSGELGVVGSGGGGGITINVDARNSTPGVEQNVRRAAAEIAEQFRRNPGLRRRAGV